MSAKKIRVYVKLYSSASIIFSKYFHYNTEYMDYLFPFYEVGKAYRIYDQLFALNVDFF